MDFMNATLVRPILWPRDQGLANWVLPHVLPLLSITLLAAETMVKATSLKSAQVRVCAREPIFPKGNPALDREPQIARRTKQVQMIRHEQVIAHQPGGGCLFPKRVQGSLDDRLRKPALPFVGADGQENPVGTTEGNVDPLSGCGSARFVWWNPVHVPRLNVTNRHEWKVQTRGRAQRGPTFLGRCRVSVGRAPLCRRRLAEPQLGLPGRALLCQRQPADAQVGPTPVGRRCVCAAWPSRSSARPR